MDTIILNIPPKIDVFSDDELYDFCRANPDLRMERDENGQIFIKMPHGTKSGIFNSRLMIKVGIWNEQYLLGELTDADTGYTLPDTSMRVPDVAWISHERLSKISGEDLKKFAHVCPDFVMELRSESDRLEDLKAKMKKWIENGVRLGWLIDPKSLTTFMYKPEQETVEKKFEEILSGEDVLPDFAVCLKDLESSR
jgi:Uma2 family endonuclease